MNGQHAGASRPDDSYGIDLNTLNYLDLFVNEFHDVLGEVLNEHLTAHEKGLRESASNTPDWNEMSGQLNVSMKKNGTISYLVDKELKDDVVKLEYGTPDAAMRPLLRSYAKKNLDTLALNIERDLRGYFSA